MAEQYTLRIPAKLEGMDLVNFKRCFDYVFCILYLIAERTKQNHAVWENTKQVNCGQKTTGRTLAGGENFRCC